MKEGNSRVVQDKIGQKSTQGLVQEREWKGSESQLRTKTQGKEFGMGSIGLVLGHERTQAATLEARKFYLDFTAILELTVVEADRFKNFYITIE